MRCTLEKMSLAQMGYHTYGTWLAWKTPTGSSVLSWSDLPMSLQNAWTAAAEVIAIEVRKAESAAEASKI